MSLRRIVLFWLLAVPVWASAETSPPVLNVTGHGSAQAAPDRAVLLCTALAQDREAAKAQARVNKLMADAAVAIKALGIRPEALATKGISLDPLYANPEPREGESAEPRIVGYQAANTLEVNLDDPARLGPVIDAAVRAGINQIDSVSFGVKDDRALRRTALTNAALDARMVADTLAKAMGLRLAGVIEVTEEVGNMPEPVFRAAKAMAAEAPTPVEVGQVRVEATVTVRYRVEPGAAP